jgi:O-antigen/teichoic acid export membrane protein
MSKIKKLISGVSWGALSTIAVAGFQLVLMAVMARLLDPVSFGIVAIANVCLRFFSYFSQMGIAPALIQKPQLVSGDIAASFTVSIGISIFFFVLVQITAPLIENYYIIPELSLVIRVLSINFIINGLSVVSVGLIRRNTAFRAIAVIEVVSYVFGYGLVGLSAAYYGMEVWALVFATMSQAIVTAVLSYAVVRHPLSFRHSSVQRRHFLSYGGRYSVIGFLEFITSNLDALIVGKVLGAAPAGYYNRGLLLANLPVQQPANILTKSLFPIMSSISAQHDKQIVSLQLCTLLVGSYAFAAGAGIYIAAPDIVKVVLGSKWLDTIPILEVLSWSVGPIYISHVIGVTLDSMNKLNLKLCIQLAMLLLLIVLLLMLAPSYRATDIAFAVVITEWIRVSIMALSMTRLLRIPIREVLLIIFCITIVTISSSLTILLISQMDIINAPLKLGVEIVAGAIGLLLSFLITRHIAVRLPAVRFLSCRSPFFSNLLPKLT